MTTIRPAYTKIDEGALPRGVRFDVPRRNQGQIIEVAYGGFRRAEHDEGDPFKRVTDNGLGVGTPDRVIYYTLAVRS